MGRAQKRLLFILIAAAIILLAIYFGQNRFAGRLIREDLYEFLSPEEARLCRSLAQSCENERNRLRRRQACDRHERECREEIIEEGEDELNEDAAAEENQRVESSVDEDLQELLRSEGGQERIRRRRR